MFIPVATPELVLAFELLTRESVESARAGNQVRPTPRPDSAIAPITALRSSRHAWVPLITSKTRSVASIRDERLWSITPFGIRRVKYSFPGGSPPVITI